MKTLVTVLFGLALGVHSLVSLVSVASATTMPRLSLEEKVAHADLIAVAQVKRQWVENIAPPQRPLRLVTFHEARVIRLIKGEAKKSLVVFAIPGGALGDLAQKVPGAPTVGDGERVLLFLGPDKGPGGARGLVGLWQGLVKLDGPRNEMDASRENQEEDLSAVLELVKASADKDGAKTSQPRLEPREK